MEKMHILHATSYLLDLKMLLLWTDASLAISQHPREALRMLQAACYTLQCFYINVLIYLNTSV